MQGGPKKVSHYQIIKIV